LKIYFTIGGLNLKVLSLIKQKVCLGEPLALNAMVEHAGNVVKYHWFKKGQPVGKDHTVYSYVPTASEDSIR
jgi:hypothetical protein